MYTEFYGLSKKPFNMTPDPGFLYLTSQHREALAGLTYAILDRKGFLVLSGTAGAGKTTLLAWVLSKLPRTRVQSSVILNPTLTREEFLELAMLDFGLQDIPSSKAQRLWMLQSFLIRGQREGKINVLIVDEAHKLSPELLEEIRLLGNFENGSAKLLQIVLIGQSELDDVLRRPDMWQLKQRIAVRLTIEPLAAADAENYIAHRWTVAGGKPPVPISGEALLKIMRWSQGIPRLINSLCDNALMLAFAEKAKMVTAGHIDAAAADLCLIARPQPAARVATAAAGGAPGAAPVTLRPITIKTFERYMEPPARPSLLSRWAGRLRFGAQNGGKPA
jgi:general secretion pathway protein A